MAPIALGVFFLTLEASRSFVRDVEFAVNRRRRTEIYNDPRTVRNTFSPPRLNNVTICGSFDSIRRPEISHYFNDLNFRSNSNSSNYSSFEANYSQDLINNSSKYSNYPQDLINSDSVCSSEETTSFFEEIKHKGLVLYIVEMAVWPPVQIVNFYFLPTRYRVLYDNVVSLFFDMFSSALCNDYDVEDVKKLTSSVL